MPKRPVTDLNTTAFSIARQFTGPPFSVTLESAELRRHLLEEIAHPGTEKLDGTGKAGPEPRAAVAGKTAAKRRKKTPKKKA